MEIYKSRFTPDVMGDEIKLEIGEKVTYQFRDGTIEDVIIKSERVSHSECPFLGYEVIGGNNFLFFANGRNILDWDGKVSSVPNKD